jgi:chemotaxis signal transduction protein
MALVDELLPHMRRVVNVDRDLHDLSLLWQMIEASSAISCPEQADTILPTLSQTRENFAGLQARLVQQLSEEHLAEVGDELASVAQCTIDILVRNLFERTADVGFLAIDDDLRAFCVADPDTQAALRPAMEQRLREYRAKYTVYDDVMALAPDGQLLVRLTDEPLSLSHDPIVSQALQAGAYVERYAVSDLAQGAGAALLYAHRILDEAGQAVGVLVLRFRCADELRRIFSSVSDKGSHIAIALIDDEGQVLLSSDEAHVPLGARLECSSANQVGVTVFAGREYLSVTCPTRGYQGYGGPGWRAQAMVSLLTAFRGAHDVGDAHENVALDNEHLQRIQSDVEAINRNLRRVVWNGRLTAGSRGGSQAQLKAVLTQVNIAGARTRDRVAHAIGDLYRTALGRARHQARELARLAADVMDRNLYERANDCRWWALSPVLQRTLAQPASPEADRALVNVLQTINGLYTVYTRLVAFDAEGVIRAVSVESSLAPLTGTRIDPALCKATFGLADSQRYAVSAFEPSPLSDGTPTYVYLAAVRAPEHARPIGGIAIVFNAEREFQAMLADVMGERTGVAAFVDAQGRVVASSDGRYPVGVSMPFDGTEAIVEHDGAHLTAAGVEASGYREFKQGDGYSNGIRAVVALRLGTLERRRTSLQDAVIKALPTANRQQLNELALFQIGACRYALPLNAVLDARSPQGLVRTPGSQGALVGLLEVPGEHGTVLVPVLCGRKLTHVPYPARATDGVVLVMPALPGQRHPAFALKVDDVSTVVEVGDEHIQPMAGDWRGQNRLVSSIVRVDISGPGAQSLIQLIDVEALAQQMGFATPARLAAN